VSIGSVDFFGSYRRSEASKLRVPFSYYRSVIAN
jgi:hypothetical protein